MSSNNIVQKALETIKEGKDPNELLGDTIEVEMDDEVVIQGLDEPEVEVKPEVEPEVKVAPKVEVKKVESNKELETLKKRVEELSEVEKSWQLVHKTFEDEGIAGLVNLLSQDKEGYKKLEENIIQKYKARENATPDELERLELIEKLEKESQQREKLMKELDARNINTQKQQEEAEKSQLQSMLHPAFEEVRFKGKVKDEAVAKDIDEAIWSLALKKLDNRGDQTPLTKELISSTFKAVAKSFGHVIEAQAQQVIEKKQVEAQNKVAGAVKANVNNSSKEAQMRSSVKSGNLKDAVRIALGLK
jgi:hypothetical protein